MTDIAALTSRSEKWPTEAKVNILLLEDQPANLLPLRAILEGVGQNLEPASSGEEALRRLKEGDFAAVLLDVPMSGLDGRTRGAGESICLINDAR